MLIDGAISVETPDTSGETVSVKGIDMSSFDVDSIALNYEHTQPDGFEANDKDKKGSQKPTNGHELVGKLVYYKKIFSTDDCENDRQTMYFKKYNEVPLLYGIFRLFDGAGHDSAAALAAIIRDCKANDEPLLLAYSVEGSTIDEDKKSHQLLATIVRSVALTRKPCNKAATSGILADPNAPPGWKKEHVEDPEDLIWKAEHEPHPLHRPLGKSVAVELNPLVAEATTPEAEEIEHGLKTLIKAKLLIKALTAGGGGGAPSSLTGGAALASENLKGRALAAVRDYDPLRGNFKKFFKARLPEVDEEFIDHFANLADDFHLKQSALKHGLKKAEIPSVLICKLEAMTIDLRKTAADLFKAEAAPEEKAPECVRFAGREVMPGRATAADGDYELVHETPEFYIARKKGAHLPDDLVKFSKSKENSHYKVHARPSVHVADLES